jgi:hypothetical protein
VAIVNSVSRRFWEAGDVGLASLRRAWKRKIEVCIPHVKK